MPRGVLIKQLRKAGAFLAGELGAGQIGVNIADKRLEFSPDGNQIIEVSVNAPYVVKYDTTANAWPARPSTSRVVFWLALSDSVADPSGAQAYDLVFKGGA